MSLDLAAPLRAAIADDESIAPQLALYAGAPAIFTRRPVPADAIYPFVLINPTAVLSDQDWYDTELPIVVRDVAIYGKQEGDQYRIVEQLGFAVRQLFHRRKWAVTVPGYDVIRLRANGPISGATEDQQIIARVVSLTIELRRQP